MTSTDDPSGAALAEQAHQAGAVTAPVELPLVDVVVSFAVRGSEAEADRVAFDFAQQLLEHPDVVMPVTFAHSVRP